MQTKDEMIEQYITYSFLSFFMALMLWNLRLSHKNEKCLTRIEAYQKNIEDKVNDWIKDSKIK